MKKYNQTTCIACLYARFFLFLKNVIEVQFGVLPHCPERGFPVYTEPPDGEIEMLKASLYMGKMQSPTSNDGFPPYLEAVSN